MLETVWPDALELLSRIKQVGEAGADLDFWHTKLKNEEAQLWVVTDAAQLVQFVLVTHINVLPTVKWLEIVFAAGSRGEEAFGLMCKLEAWAKDQGIDIVTITGRKGWKRWAGKIGFKESAITLTKYI